MKFDTDQPGLLSVFKPYKLESLRFLFDQNEAVGSVKVWRHLHTLPDESLHVSRASVINFLNDMVDEEICVWEDATGKGGHRRLYGVIPEDEDALKSLIASRIEGFLERELRARPLR